MHVMDIKWGRLGTLLKYQRVVVLGQRNRAKFARDLGLTGDRLLARLENAEQDKYEPATLLSLPAWYHIHADTLADVLGEDWPGAPPDADRMAIDAPSDGSITIAERGRGERSGQNVLTVRREGLEIETTYTDAEDRARVLADILRGMGVGS